MTVDKDIPADIPARRATRTKLASIPGSPTKDLASARRVEVVQRKGDGPRQVNNRTIVTPHWHAPLRKLNEARGLPASSRTEIEEFFMTTAKLAGKKLKIKRWASRRSTEQFPRQSLA